MITSLQRLAHTMLFSVLKCLQGKIKDKLNETCKSLFLKIVINVLGVPSFAWDYEIMGIRALLHLTL